MKSGNLWLLLPKRQHLFQRSILLLLTLMAVLRFGNLLADPPVEFIKTINFIYTDEGWWSRNAVAIVREGHWYIDDGFNPIFALPVVPLLQALCFKIFGVSLSAARGFTATCTLILAGLVYLLVRRFLPSNFAFLAPLTIVCHFAIFIYSRLALLEFPTLVFVLISILLIFDRKPVSNFRVVLATLFLPLAILAKTTAIFAIPLIASLIWLQKQPTTNKIRHTLIFLTVFLLVAIAGSSILLVNSSVSLETLVNKDILSKFHYGIGSLFISPLGVAYRAWQVFPILFPLSVLSIFVFNKAPKYRFNPLIFVTGSWFATAFLMLSSSHYSPQRYMMVFSVPIAIAVPLIVDFIINYSQGKVLRTVLGCALLLCLSVNVLRIGNYLVSYERSFAFMANDVGSYVRQQPDRSQVIMGHFADTVSLINGVKSINDNKGDKSLDYRIQQFDPGYYISLGEITPGISNTLNKYYKTKLLQTYDVYGNLHHQKPVPVFFYQLAPR